jgi:hypothetical protein
MPPRIRDWILKQMNARDAMDGVAVVVKLAVQEFGPKKVASELRRLAARLEHYGDLPGWKFPRRS